MILRECPAQFITKITVDVSAADAERSRALIAKPPTTGD
jgi:hypothetical protein